MKIIVMATGPFSVPMLRQLVRSSHTIQAVVSKPEKNRPGKKLPPAPARQAAEELGLPLLTPESANAPEFIAVLKDLAPDVLIVCDYGQILSAETLATARLGGLNLHGSLLPAYRGAAPVQWAIYRGETVTGVTVIHMSPKLDAGPCVCQLNVTIAPNETASQLESRLAELGAPLVTDALNLLASWDAQTPLGHPQDPQRVSSARRLRKEDARVDWSRTSEQIVNQVRAWDPWPGTITSFVDAKGVEQTLRLVQVSVPAPSPPTPLPRNGGEGRIVDTPLSGNGGEGSMAPSPLPQFPAPGTIHIDASQNLFVRTGSGWLELRMVIPANRKGISGAEFVRGFRIQDGDILGRNDPGNNEG